MTLWILIYTGLLIWKAFSIHDKRTLVLYLATACIGIALIYLYAARILPRFAELVTGW